MNQNAKKSAMARAEQVETYLSFSPRQNSERAALMNRLVASQQNSANVSL
jgi:hypothetical protein